MSLHAKPHVDVCIRKVYVCLAATCHLYFWQNGWGLLSFMCYCSNGGGGGGGGGEMDTEISQHRKLTPEKKILLPLLQRFEPMTFQSQVWRSNH